MNNKDTPVTWTILNLEATSQGLWTKARYIFYYTIEIQNCLAYEFYYKVNWLSDKKITTKAKNPDSEGDFTTKAPVHLFVRGSCQG